jgi:UDP-GlcNAc:undecaprenyl-phosphate/decaprenyl-phosphate GlcNAc-1-phosphate transferase
MTSLTAFGVALLAALVLTPVVRGAAHGAGMFDTLEARKVPRAPVPRLGGVAIGAAFYLGIAAALVATRLMGRRLGVETGHLPAVLVGVAMVGGVGLLDDLQGMRARAKLAAQVVIALVVYGLGLSVDRLDGPWGTLELGLWSLPVTVAWIVGVINALNLIDGLDGLASGVALLAIGAFVAIGLTLEGAGSLLPVLAAGAGGVLGFLRFNLPPASIIMGDTGSMLLGFLLAASAIGLSQAVPGTPPWIPLLVLALPLGDTGRVMLTRVAAGRPIFAPDRGHVHHRLLGRGLSPRATMLVLWVASALLGAAAWGLTALAA